MVIGLLSLLIMLSLTSWAQDAGSYLTTQFHVRSSGMSGAGVAFSRSGALVYSNPATIRNAPATHFVQTSNFNRLETEYTSLDYTRRFDRLSINTGFRNARVDGIIETASDTTYANSPLSDNTPYMITGTSSWDSAMYHVAIAGDPYEWLTVGAMGQYIHENLIGYTAYGHGFNAGALIQPKSSPYTVGVSLYNVGDMQLTWDSGRQEPVQQGYAIGVSRHFLDDRVMVITEWQSIIVSDWIIGAELMLNETIALRMGNRASNLSFGVGFAWSWLSLDIAYQHESRLYNNDVFKVAMGIQWE